MKGRTYESAEAYDAQAEHNRNKELRAQIKELKRELAHKDELLEQAQAQYTALLEQIEGQERKVAEAVEEAAEAALRYNQDAEACRTLMGHYKTEMEQLMGMLRKQKRKGGL